ncbi:hypothetical protein CHUAL_002837 [Chamberlinius hualienensis]
MADVILGIEGNSTDLQDAVKTDEIIKWLKTIPNFKPRTDSAFAKRFLVGSKYDVAKTKQRILNYYQNRKNYADLLTNRDFLEPKMQALFNRGLMVMIFNLAVTDRPFRVYCDLSRLEAGDIAKEVYHLGYTAIETMLLIDNVVKEGTEWVVNVKGIPLSFIAQLTPKFIYIVVKSSLVGLPIRLKAIHIVNVHPAVMVVINCLKALLTPKLRKRVYMHKNSWQVLHKHIPHNEIPDEFGGTGGPMEDYMRKNREFLFSSRNYLLDDEQYGFI